MSTPNSFFKRKQNTNNLFSFANFCLLNINIIEKIDDLNEFMLSKQNSTINMICFENNQDIFSSIPLNTNKENLTPPILYPKHKNSLFWCIFIAINGYNEYLMIGNKFANKEFEEQQRIMQYIKENGHEMKSLKMKITNSLLQQIMSELLVENTSNLLLVNAYSVYYKSTIYVLNQNNHTYVIFGNKNDEYSNTIIIQYNNKKYGLNNDIQINNIDNEYLFLENFEKPLKSISNYKLDDLKQLCIKFNNFNKNKYDFDINNKKKQDFYDLLCQLCIWK